MPFLNMDHLDTIGMVNAIVPDQPHHADLVAVRRAQAWYDAHLAHCPRSAEWKHGARAGCFKAHGLAPQCSPWASGTAQDDARNAGFAYGYQQAVHELRAQVHA